MAVIWKGKINNTVLTFGGRGAMESENFEGICHEEKSRLRSQY
jgi:hypothetical protein